MLDGAWAQRWMSGAAKAVAGAREELNSLDRAIGDGDHGENLNRGFAAVVAKLQPEQSPGEVIQLAAMTLMSVVGGAAGPLYGTAFLRMSTAFGSAAEVTTELLRAGLTAARDGLVQRGKAELGDKTMVDAFIAAVDAADEAASNSVDPESALAAVAAAAADAAESTIDMQARKGRASYLAERSIGHTDPGAASTALILQAGADAAAFGEG